MLDYIFGTLNYGTLLIFGVFVSAAFLNIKQNKKNIMILLSFSFCLFTFQIVSFALINYEVTEWLYPLITHFPLVLFFKLYYKRSLLSSTFSVMSSYLCCHLSKWISILSLEFIGVDWVAYGIRSVITIILCILILRYFASSISVILSKPTKTILIFYILPATYYIFDYITTVYTDLLYTGSEAVFEFLPFVLCIAYLVFSVVYFKEYEQKCEVERHNQLMELRRSQTEKEIEAIKRSEYTVSLIRHDMRHFLNSISLYIENGETEKAKAYISEVIASADKSAMRRYCENEIVNMILSSYEIEIEEKNINFQHSIRIPSALPFSDVDLTSIISNGLENAINAVSELDEKSRIITFDLHMSDDKLLLSIKNPYANIIELVDGVPHSKESGHGLGTHSIKYVTEKLKGNCQFVAKDGQFTLRVVL